MEIIDFDTEDENFVAIKFWKIKNQFDSNEIWMNHDIDENEKIINLSSLWNCEKF